MKPKIVQLEEKLLVGISMEMSVIENKTATLWKTFRSAKYKIPFTASDEYISLQQYPKDYFVNFNPSRSFVKWAGVEVTQLAEIPSALATLVITGGLYAVFHRKGTDPSIFQYIYEQWIPNSEYELDDRPHFEVLGAHYKMNDPNAEEKIWIPVKLK